MKNFIFLILAFTCVSTSAIAQLKVVAPGDVGIGIDAPAEKLDVDGALKIGTTTNSNAGTIRYTGSDFEGRVGTAWKSLTGGASGGAGGYFTAAGDNITYAGGFVGFNEADPQYPIHASRSDGTANGFLIDRPDVGTFVRNSVGNNGSSFWFWEDKFFAITPGEGIFDVVSDRPNSIFIMGPNWANGPGNVGIGTISPTAKLEVNGNIKASSFDVVSDARTKSSSHAFKAGLKELLMLSPITFEYNGKAGTVKGSKNIGIMAQDLQKIVPELVEEFTHTTYSEQNINEYIKVVKQEKFLQIKDSQIKYLLLNAIQEQQKIIQNQDKKILALNDKLDRLEKLILKSAPNTKDR